MSDSNKSEPNMGIFSHKSNLMDSPATMISIITVLCALLVVHGTADSEPGSFLMGVNLTAAIIDFAVVAGWLVWATYIIMAKRVLVPMNPKPYRIVNRIGTILLLFWLAVRCIPSAAGPWMVPVAITAWGVCVAVAVALRKRPGSSNDGQSTAE